MDCDNAWHRTTLLTLTMMLAVSVLAADRIATDADVVEGTVSTGARVHIFRGIPFAAPPVGALRWKAPQPVANWAGVGKATKFGARCQGEHNFGSVSACCSGDL